MNEKIEPALTAEEWARFTGDADPDFIDLYEATEMQGRVIIEGGGMIRVSYDGGYASQEVNRDDFCKLAKLALYGKPFGFTREDVEQLYIAQLEAQKAADVDCTCPECQETVDRFKSRLRSIADRIEALLPPESAGEL